MLLLLVRFLRVGGAWQIHFDDGMVLRNIFLHLLHACRGVQLINLDILLIDNTGAMHV